MTDGDIRIGAFEETAPLELPTHWRNIFEGHPDRVDFLFSRNDTEAEIRASEEAKKQLNDLGYGDYL
jgi:hypothetical protein